MADYLGGHLGKVAELDVMLKEYYEVRGWSTEGVPTEEKVQELGL